MTLHKNLVEAVVDALDLIFNQKLYADKVVEYKLKSNKKWGSRDRRFVAEAIYECVRWKRLYDALAGASSEFSEQNLWRIVGVYLIVNKIELPDWDLFSNLFPEDILKRYEKLQSERVYRESIPDWLDNLGTAELGEKWEEEIHALNQKATAIIRVNTLKISRKELQKVFKNEGIETEILADYPDALLLPNRANIFHSQAFHKGFFEMQDASSQLVSPFLQVAPGMRVVDACAGAGGKTLHLASLMENKGQIIALDIFDKKLEALKKRARRNGAHNIDIRPIINNKTIKKLHESADRVLIDAPCSGLGVIRRNPDAKWKMQPDFIKNLIETQAQILDQYATIVKKGGSLVYATCSILPSENEKQIEKFLQYHQEFLLVTEKKVSPALSGFDGFYMARLEKKD